MTSNPLRHPLLRRSAWYRLVPLALLLLLWAYVTPVQQPVSAGEWLLAAASAAAFTISSRLPLAVVCGQAAMIGGLLLAERGAFLGAHQLMLAICLAELAARRNPLPQVVVGATVSAAVSLRLLMASNIALSPAPTSVRLLIIVGVPVLAGRYLRGLRQIAQHYRTEAEQVKRIRDAEVLAARVAERTAVARELHDLVAHHVSSIVLRVAAARHVVREREDDPVKAVLDDVHAAGTTALADLRLLVKVLRDPAADAPSLVHAVDLMPELQRVVERCAKAGHRVTSRVDPEVSGLDAVGRLALLRVVQEAITNVLRHADSDSEVSVEIDVLQENGVRAVVLNTGARDRGEPAGYGLVGMQERAQLAGGCMAVTSDADLWRVEVFVPFERTESTEDGSR